MDNGEKTKVLIIEDDIQIAELQRDYLEISDFAADIETDGESGLKKAVSEDYALIILDIMLPNMNGFEICRKLREHKNIPVIFVSAKTDDTDKIRGLGLGADDYMVKPFSPGELVARVKAHIKRYGQLTEQGKNSDAERENSKGEINMRGIYMNPNSRKVKIDGKDIYMPLKEFDLLYYLVMNPDKIFSKEQLLNKIWGADAFVEPATIAVHINRIRDKIEKNPASPVYIETIWGIGYRFIL